MFFFISFKTSTLTHYDIFFYFAYSIISSNSACTWQVRGLILFFFTGNEDSQTCSLGHLGTIAKPVLSEHVPALGSLPRLLRLLLPSSSSSTVTAFIKFSKSHGDQ